MAQIELSLAVHMTCQPRATNLRPLTR